jgi:hypothetical protein
MKVPAATVVTSAPSALTAQKRQGASLPHWNLVGMYCASFAGVPVGAEKPATKGDSGLAFRMERSASI